MLFICLIYRFWNPPWGPNPVELEYKYTKKSYLTQGKEISKFQWILSKKVYWKILNYRLCRILRIALTHVPYKFTDQECLMSISSRYYHLWRRNQIILSAPGKYLYAESQPGNPPCFHRSAIWSDERECKLLAPTDNWFATFGQIWHKLKTYAIRSKKNMSPDGIWISNKRASTDQWHNLVCQRSTQRLDISDEK